MASKRRREEAMTKRIQLNVIDRRDFVLGASAAAAVTALLSASAGTAWAKSFSEVVKAAVGDAKPTEGKVSLELPEIAENGNTVPFAVSVESPMTDKDYVKSVHVFAEKNPNPEVVVFNFTPMSGKASAKSRMRLATTQDVIAIATMSSGALFIGKRTVKVTIGGCGG
jgi:sulfur-oxidizing protein SoxY